MAAYCTLDVQKLPFEIAPGTCPRAFDLYNTFNNLRPAADPPRKPLSDLHLWCSRNDAGVSHSDPVHLTPELQSFTLSTHVDEIVDALIKTDVVVLSAPTGSGKSLLAPYLYKRYLQKVMDYNRHSNNLFNLTNKCLMFVPNGSHVGGVTRMCSKLYMKGGSRKCEVGGFYHPFHEVTRDRRIGGLSDSPLEFNLTSYEFGEKLLSDAFLNLLILDEAHEANPCIILSIAAALRLLTGGGDPKKRRLERLLLMTATMTDEDVEQLRGKFESAGLKFRFMEFDDIPSMHSIEWSCLTTPRDRPMTPFKSTALSRSIGGGNYNDEVLKARAQQRDLRNIKDIAESVPNMKELVPRVFSALKHAMVKSLEAVRNGATVNVPTIIVILPGLDYVDSMWKKVLHMDEIRLNGETAFIPLRITSAVRDDANVTSPCEALGSWGGRKGRVILATNMIATGITVPGAAYVIDCGVTKVRSEYARNGLYNLELEFIDQNMMVQRAGRTGRTNDGEYCITLSMKRVEEIVDRNLKREQMQRLFDEIHWFRARHYRLSLVWQPPAEVMRRMEKSFVARGYLHNDSFTETTLILAEYLPFLQPDYARIVVQGIQLGVAAHAVLYVADLISNVKLIAPPSPGRAEQGGPSDEKSGVDIFASVTYGQKHSPIGDTIAHVDFIVSLFHTLSLSDMPFTRASDAARWNMDWIPEGSFWRGEWKERRERDGTDNDFAHLYGLFVRDEGRDATLRYRRQIEGACHAMGLLKGNHLFAKEWNRYTVGEGNMCLNERGKAVFMALLTMHSSRFAARGVEERGRRVEIVHERYTVIDDEKREELIIPERNCWKSDADHPFGRYTEAFKRGCNKHHQGCIDPITLHQLAFFGNINTSLKVERLPSQPNSCLKLAMNGAPASEGFRLFGPHALIDSINYARQLLRDASERLVKDHDEDLALRLQRALIELWEKCERK